MPYSCEQALMGWLRGLGYACYPSPPMSRPERFVTVERTSGAPMNLVDHPTIAVQAWAKTDAEAEEDAMAIAAAALTSPLPEGIHSLRVSAGPYRFPDGQSKARRYQLVLDCSCRLI